MFRINKRAGSRYNARKPSRRGIARRLRRSWLQTSSMYRKKGGEVNNAGDTHQGQDQPRAQEGGLHHLYLPRFILREVQTIRVAGGKQIKNARRVYRQGGGGRQPVRGGADFFFHSAACTGTGGVDSKHLKSAAGETR